MLQASEPDSHVSNRHNVVLSFPEPPPPPYKCSLLFSLLKSKGFFKNKSLLQKLTCTYQILSANTLNYQKQSTCYEEWALS